MGNSTSSISSANPTTGSSTSNETNDPARGSSSSTPTTITTTITTARTNVITNSTMEQVHPYLATDLPRYIVEGPLPTRSGRIFRGYRVRSNNEQQYGVSMVCKVAIFKRNGSNSNTNTTNLISSSSSPNTTVRSNTPPTSTITTNKSSTNNNHTPTPPPPPPTIISLQDELEYHSQELYRIFTAVSNPDTHPHILPYQRWIVPYKGTTSSTHKKSFYTNNPITTTTTTTNSTTTTITPTTNLSNVKLPSTLPYNSNIYNNNSNNLQPVYLLRQHCYANLSDRLATRPFLTKIEKLWIIYQILVALQSLHDVSICHGHLTTDNIMVTSWNWIIITDISSQMKPTLLPKDDPSIFLQYFQKSHQAQQASSTSTTSTTTTTIPSSSSSSTSTATATSAAAAAAATTSTSTNITSNDNDISKRCYIAPERFYNTRTTTTTTINQSNQQQTNQGQYTPTILTSIPLTPAMDIFSVGCVLIETMLNDGERACELGDIMEYISSKKLPETIVRKLNKIKSSSLRAACRHMLSLQPEERKCASTYIDRLTETGVFPPCFSTYLWPFLKRLRSDFLSPDSRIAYAATSYTDAIQHTTTTNTTTNNKTTATTTTKESTATPRIIQPQHLQHSIHDDDNNNDYFDLLVGNTAREIMYVDSQEKKSSRQNSIDDTKDYSNVNNDKDDQGKVIKAATTKDSTSLSKVTNDNEGFSSTSPSQRHLDSHEAMPSYLSQEASPSCQQRGSTISNKKTFSPAQLSPDTLLIYLQVTLASLRHVQRPSSKLVALQIIHRSSNYLSDDARLQRIVPNVVSLLEDPNAIIRATSIRVLAYVLSLLQGFPPSDSLVFPQYIFKRISPLIHDDSIVVRVAFAESMALLAETAQRFLDVTHATRLYEAVGGSVITTSTSSNTVLKEAISISSSSSSGKQVMSPFSNDVTKLLDKGSKFSTNTLVNVGRRGGTIQQVSPHSASSTVAISSKTSAAASEVLIPNTYDVELSALQETVFDWVVQIATDSSSNSTFLKRALLSDLPRLCAFFGRDGVTSQILPQILAFLNNRTDWQLRAALTRHLPSACAVVGRVATQHFVVPCVETAIFDEEEQVTNQALLCLASLVSLGLLTRTMLLGTSRNNLNGLSSLHISSPSSVRQNTSASPGLLERYAPLLLHPSRGIRQGIHSLISATCMCIGSPDDVIFVLPILLPYLQYEPSSKQLCCIGEFENCFLEPISTSSFEKEIARMMKSKVSNTSSHMSTVDVRATNNKDNDDVVHVSLGSYVDMGVIVESGNETAVECSMLVSADTNATIDTYPEQKHNEGWTEDPSQQPLNVSPSQDMSEAERLAALHSYLLMTSNYRQSMTPRASTFSAFKEASTPNISAAYNFLFPNQKFIELFSDTIPQWYEEVREAARLEKNGCPETSSFRSLTSVAMTYGIAITAPSNSSQISRKWKGDSTFTLDDITIESLTMLVATPEVGSSERKQILLHSIDSRLISSALEGEWGSMVQVDPTFVDMSLLIEKIQSLRIPPLPPRLGVLQDVNSRPFSWHGPVAISSETHVDVPARNDWKPCFESVVISSSTKTEHTAAITRLAVSQDQRFFVSASHDGTSRVWNLYDVQDSTNLKSSLTYSGHLNDGNSPSFGVRLNDICMVENSHSVATCSSNGAVHVWRVDLASAAGKSGAVPPIAYASDRGSLRVSGSSVIRRIDYRDEGEVIAVSHFNTTSSSILAFATEKGIIHSWDLRCANEPFNFIIRPELGYLTTFSTLFDRNCFVAGTSRGYIALMDVRYQLCVKVWRHSSESIVSRLATCFTTLPQDKDGKSSTTTYGAEPRPYIFMGCGSNEASVFDLSTATCRQCFRVLDPSLCYINQQMMLPPECISMPELNNVPLPRNPLRPISSASSYACSSFLHFNGNTGSHYSDAKIFSLMGRLGMQGQHQQYLITGGSDKYLRYWDFSSPSKCYTISGLAHGQPRPIYQKVDVGAPDQQLFLCQQMPFPSAGDVETVRFPSKMKRGLVRPENTHQGSILDLKSVEFPSKGLLSCSQDGMIKLWR